MWSSLARRLVLIFGAALLLLGAVAPSTAMAAPTLVDSIEDEFFGQFNDERSARGLAPFQRNQQLEATAIRWSSEMASGQGLQHSSEGLAEIIGYGGWSGQITVAFMNSPSHRNLVVDPNLGQIGIGVVCDENDRLWATAQFYRIDRTLGTQRSSAASPIVTPTAQGSDCNDHGATASIERLYLAILGRPADDAGLRYWSTRVENGVSVVSVADRFVGSDEYRQIYGTTPDAEFVDDIYRSVLGRTGDSQGRAYWIARLERGMTRGAVVASFTESPDLTG